MKELPKVFQNKIDKKINNNESFYYSNLKDNSIEPQDSKTIIQKINEIFSSPNYVYKANVEITLKDKVLNKRIIGRNKDYIITMDNELIKISDIVDIKSIKEKS